MRHNAKLARAPHKLLRVVTPVGSDALRIEAPRLQFAQLLHGDGRLGVNYGWILSAWGVAGVAGPLFVARVKDATGSYTGALPVMAAVLAAAVILPVLVRPPRRGATTGR